MYVELADVNRGAALGPHVVVVGVVRTWVLPPITATSMEGFSDIGVLAIVTWPPGVNVLPATTNCEALFTMYIVLAIESRGDKEGFGLEANKA